MTTPDRYRAFARECMQWAEKAKDIKHRETLLDMSACWAETAAHVIWTNPSASRPMLRTERDSSKSLVRPAGNRLLAALPDDAFILLEPDLRQLTLPQGVVCHGAGDPINQVYFPHTGMISQHITTGDGDMVETSSTGREGAVGLQCGFGPRLSFTRTMVQIGWFGALEDTGSVSTYLAEGVEDVGAVAHQATNVRIGTCRVDSGKCMTRSQYCKLDTPCVEERSWRNKQSVRLLMLHTVEGAVDIAARGDIEGQNLLSSGSRPYFTQDGL